ncbi:MAG: hypothetical protein D6698_11350, partial [Gammaproteobacteria bacterium]
MNGMKRCDSFFATSSGRFWYNSNDDTLWCIPRAPGINHTSVVLENPYLFGVDENELPADPELDYDIRVMYPAMRNGWVRIMLDQRNLAYGGSNVEGASVEDLKNAVRQMLDKNVFGMDDDDPAKLAVVLRQGAGDDQYTIDRFSTVGELREYVGENTDSDENGGNPFSGLEKITQIIASFTPFAVVSA